MSCCPPLLALALSGLVACEPETPPPAELPGTFGSDPAVVTEPSGATHLFIKGRDKNLWHSICVKPPCSSHARFGLWNAGPGAPPVGVGSSPAAVTNRKGRIDLFVRGEQDGALWHQTWLNSSWLGWENLGGYMLSAPAATYWEPDRLDVFVLAPGSVVWQRACQGLGVLPCRGSRWEPWAYPLGQTPVPFVGDLAAASWAAGRIDVFGLGNDGNYWQRAWDGSRWTGWRELHGNFSTRPAVATAGHGQMWVYGGDRKGRLKAFRFDGRTAASPTATRSKLKTNPTASRLDASTFGVFARAPRGDAIDIMTCRNAAVCMPHD